MGVVNSRAGEGNGLYLSDQARFTISSVVVTNARNRVLLRISPDAFPATRYFAKREHSDDGPVEYIEDPESSIAGLPSMLLRFNNDEDLKFSFALTLHQVAEVSNSEPVDSNSADSAALTDTKITGLTFIAGSSAREVENIVTKDFYSDPNIHKNPNVEFIGECATNGKPEVTIEFLWKWQQPRPMEDRGGGWRCHGGFVEYDQRVNRFVGLGGFTIWVQNTQRMSNSPRMQTPRLDLNVPPRLRLPSTQSIGSRISDSDGGEMLEVREPQSPGFEPVPENGTTGPTEPLSNVSTKVDVSCNRPGEDMTAVDDGPLWRATISSLEQKTGSIKSRMKRVLRSAEKLQESQGNYNDSMEGFINSLRDAASSNANAVQPALDHYFEKIAKEILRYERSNVRDLQKLVIEPIHKLYSVDIKQADGRKREFDEESKEYYSYLGRYMSQRQDSVKDKKRAQSDSKHESKRKTFELKRFDYTSFMQDLGGGRKDQEVLSQLTKYADAQAHGFLQTAKKIEELLPQLDALTSEVREADREFQIQRTEREEKRRAIEKNAKGIPQDTINMSGVTLTDTVSSRSNEHGLTRSTSTAHAPSRGLGSLASAIGSGPINTPGISSAQSLSASSGMNSGQLASSPAQNKFQGIRDLEEKVPTAGDGQQRKEGLVFAMNRPGSHIDPKGLNKAAWHKFWIVLDQGKLSEYVNWKQRMEMHMEPIDLRMASVREARNAERRFCFEVITPHFTRIYQAQNEDDMRSWISAVNNALQGAFEAKGPLSDVAMNSSPVDSKRNNIAAVLTGKSSSLSSHRASAQFSTSSGGASKVVARHATVGDRPDSRRAGSGISSTVEEHKLLKAIREADAGNLRCADCNSESKVEWASINLGIILCIECGGIHRSLGTHISKIRSLTLDTHAFTPDIVELLLQVGNRVSNMVWEATLDRNIKPTAQATREQRLKFITAKYSEASFVEPLSGGHSHFSTPDDVLLTSVKKNDLQNIIWSLALRANPNAHDRSRQTHAVFLALAAADPALPGSGPPSPNLSAGRPRSSTNSPSQAATQAIRKPFAAAELLMQNGAELPTAPAPIPLSSAAQAYIDFKVEQRGGISSGSNANKTQFLQTPVSTPGAVPLPRNPSSSSGSRSFSKVDQSGYLADGNLQPLQATNGDTLTALPQILAGNGSTVSERTKERDRLMRRAGSTGRLTKPGPLSSSAEGDRR